MNTIELRSEIMLLLHGESNTTVLEAIRMLLRREEAEEDITDEELAEMEAQRADRISGKTKFVSEEESIRMIREVGKE